MIFLIMLTIIADQTEACNQTEKNMFCDFPELQNCIDMYR